MATKNIVEFNDPTNATPRVLLALFVFIPLNAILAVVYALGYGAGAVIATAFQALFTALAFIATPLPGPGIWGTYTKFFSALRGEQIRVGSAALEGAFTNIVQGKWALAAPPVKLV